MQEDREFYQFKEILDGRDAVRYLNQLTGSQQGAKDLIELVTSLNIRAFINAYDLEPSSTSFIEKENKRPVLPIGLQEVVHGLSANAVGRNLNHGQTFLRRDKRPPLVFNGNTHQGPVVDWRLRQTQTMRVPINLLFKPADIQTLANKLSDTYTKQSGTASVSELKQPQGANKRLGATEQDEGSGFPYPTPELEVMKKAAQRFWSNYSDEYRKPSQKEIAGYIADSLQIEYKDEIPRLARDLAIAIKPVKYRDR